MSAVKQAVVSSIPPQALPGDVAVKLSPSSSVALSMDGASAALGITGSNASIGGLTRGCVATSPGGCSAQVQQFMLNLSSFTMDTTLGHFVVTNPTMRLTNPTAVLDTGSGFVLPTGTLMTFSATVAADLLDEHFIAPQSALQTAAITAPATFRLSLATQDLVINGSFPFQIQGTQGDVISGTITLSATAQKPFLNTPPAANAGPDQTVNCGQQVTLDGTRSSDLENNIQSYLWTSNGALIATGAIAHVTLPVGVNNLQLNVQDAFGGSGVDLLKVVVSPGDNRNCCPAGSHVLVGTSNNDVLTGTAGVDCILGLGGQDTINGLGGNDIISGGDGNDLIHGGDGDDLIFGGTGQDQVFGDNGNDVLSGDDGDDRVDGAAGNDTLYGGQGQDTLICGPGTNRAFGGFGDDTLNGGVGSDVLDGGPDHNSCVGGGGSDQFISCTTVR